MTNAFGIIGHAHTLEQLRVLEDRHAFLLSGTPRIGKRELARWLVARVNCASAGERPCGVCPSCLALERGTHPDLLEIGPKLETASGKQARKAIIPIKAIAASRDDGHDYEVHALEWLRLGPQYRRKAVVIDGAEFLNTEAANALLKVVEEPPHGALFVFLTRDHAEVISTIVSRCTRLTVPPVSEAEMRRALERLEGHEDPELLAFAAGRPGVLLERDRARKALNEAQSFLGALETGMLEAMTAGEALEKGYDAQWHPEALGFLARRYGPRERLVVDTAVRQLQERLEQYANPALSFAVLALELRAGLGHAA